MTIDVHGHISPPESLRRFPMPPSLGDVTGMIERKLALGVRMTIVGSPVGAGAMVPLPGVDNYAQSDDELRRFHDWIAATVAAHPAHLRGLVYANPFGDDRHLAGVADTYRGGEFVGLIVNTSVNGRYLNDGRADAFFALAAEVGAPVVLHAPAAPVAGTGLSDLRLLEQLGRFGDVTIGVACCLLGGWLDRYPGLRLVATGGGGGLALLTERLDLIASMPHWRGAPRGGPPPTAGPPSPAAAPDAVAGLRRRPSAYLEHVWFDTATPSRAGLAANLAAFGGRRLMFGTDSPPLLDVVEPGLAAIDALPVDEATRDDIRWGNAARLFGLAAPDARVDAGRPASAAPTPVGAPDHRRANGAAATREEYP
ncbi:amidohydrolase family protein [Micromonospora sp. NPDC049171]|uniref:amidohydrolase family protein n=1 Tax=Micromonospora sp. NPDC049171 TaxID=3155770 RepID=UPI0033EA4C07